MKNFDMRLPINGFGVKRLGVDSHSAVHLLNPLGDHPLSPMASLLAPYGDRDALSIARDLDAKVEDVLRQAAA